MPLAEMDGDIIILINISRARVNIINNVQRCPAVLHASFGVNGSPRLFISQQRFRTPFPMLTHNPLFLAFLKLLMRACTLEHQKSSRSYTPARLRSRIFVARYCCTQITQSPEVEKIHCRVHVGNLIKTSDADEEVFVKVVIERACDIYQGADTFF